VILVPDERKRDVHRGIPGEGLEVYGEKEGLDVIDVPKLIEEATHPKLLPERFRKKGKHNT
jgi:hypothetical protein